MLVLYGFLAFHLVSGFTVMNVTRSNETRTKGEWVPCGQDQLEGRTIEEGMTEIENFPWLGLLVYPINGDNPTTTAVVLISDDVVLSSALDIDYYNKENFRALSRVVLGNNCTGPYISIREYTFHPEFTRSTYSTLALVQLAIDINVSRLIPICPPPSTFMNSEEIFAMTLVNDCYNSSMVNIFKMDYMDATQCQDYYRRAGLDIQSMWPTHLACAQGQVGGHCIWRSGATLVIRHEGQWKLLGIGVYGPGCESPSRFLDYGMYHLWVKRITSKIGQPTISRIANNYVVLRRSTSNIQRFGLCDAEETTKGIYADSATMLAPHDEYDEVDPVITAYYNVTLLENVDYHCIIFQAKKELSIPGTPLIKLRRVCPDEDNSCTNSTGRILRYYAVIKFKHICTFSVNAYGVYLATNETDTDEET